MTVETIISERAATHGEYNVMATLAQNLKNTMRATPGWRNLVGAQKESLDLIATKVARILCGDPNHRDSWNDIQGYAALAERAILEREEA